MENVGSSLLLRGEVVVSITSPHLRKLGLVPSFVHGASGCPLDLDPTPRVLWFQYAEEFWRHPEQRAEESCRVPRLDGPSALMLGDSGTGLVKPRWPPGGNFAQDWRHATEKRAAWS